MSTKLEAVNTMLDAIGEAPVSSLSSGLDDAETAERILNKVTKDILSIGWHVNTDENVSLSPNTDGHVLLPPTVLRVDTVGTDRGINVTSRVDPNDGMRKLFRIKEQSYTFAAPVQVTITHLFDFEGLTHDLQRYITAAAARAFQKSTVASGALDKMLAEEEARALAALNDAEAESEDLNILTDNEHCRSITFRRNSLWGT